MKRLTETTSITIIIIGVLSFGLVNSCNVIENVVPKESELAKYPQWQPFLAGRTGFRGIRHDLDTNFYSFAFSTSLSSDAYFDVVHSEASRQGWELVDSGKLKRVYRRHSNSYPAARHHEKITLSYDTGRSEVIFVEEPDYSRGKSENE